jgi:multiple sugar transport system permease protein
MAGASHEYATALPLGYDSETVRAVLAEFIGHHSENWEMAVTGDRIASLPPMALSLVFYRHEMSGLTNRGLKG